MRAVSSSESVCCLSALLNEDRDDPNARRLMPGEVSKTIEPSAVVFVRVPFGLTVDMTAAPPVNDGAVFHWLDCRLKLDRFM